MAAFEVNAVHVHGACAHLHQVKYVAAVERQVVDLRGTHRRGQLRVFCVHLRRSAGDFDHFRSLADLQLKVHVRDDTRIQHDVVIRVSLEAGGFGRQLVRTDRKFLHRIVTAGIGRSGNGNADCRVCNRNLGARNGGAGWIQHGTGKLAVLHLRECAEG